MNIERPCPDPVRVSPNFAQKIGTARDLARPVAKSDQQFVLFTRQTDGPAINFNDVLSKIDFEMEVTIST